MSTPAPRFDYVSHFSSRDWPSDLAEIRAAAFPDWYPGKPDRVAYPRDFLLVANLDDVVVGYAFIDAAAGPPACTLYELAVGRIYRGLGIGTALVREAARWLGSQQYSLMYVQALEDEHHDRRIEWFERLGFSSPDAFTMHSASI